MTHSKNFWTSSVSNTTALRKSPTIGLNFGPDLIRFSKRRLEPTRDRLNWFVIADSFGSQLLASVFSGKGEDAGCSNLPTGNPWRGAPHARNRKIWSLRLAKRHPINQGACSDPDFPLNGVDSHPTPAQTKYKNAGSHS
jgi:hypothetical protein